MTKKHLPATTTGSSVALRKVSNSLAITNKLLATIDERPTEEDWAWWNGLNDEVKRLLTAHIYHGDNFDYEYDKLQEIGRTELINPKEDLKQILDLTSFCCSSFLSNRFIEDISFLTNLVNLTELNLEYNKINDLSPLINMVNLNKLYLKMNYTHDLSPLANLINLNKLDLTYNYDIHDLSPLTNLSELNLTGNYAININTLSNLNNLTVLDLSKMEIDNISVLSNLTHLTKYSTKKGNELEY